MQSQEHIINQYLTVKQSKTGYDVYVGGEKVPSCACNLLDIDTEIALLFEGGADEYRSEVGEEPAAFEEACFILDQWSSLNYNTRAMTKEASFPLLKRLYDAGDPLARRVFAKEIEKRLLGGNQSVVTYLFEENFYKYLGEENLLEIKKENEFARKARLAKTFYEKLDEELPYLTLLEELSGSKFDMELLTVEFGRRKGIEPLDESSWRYLPVICEFNSTERLERLGDLSNEDIAETIKECIDSVRLVQFN